MTTHDQHTETTDFTEDVESSTAGIESSTPGTGPSTADTEPSTAGTEPSTAGTEPSIAGTEPSIAGTGPSTAGTESSTEKSLFAEDELSGLRSRWNDVQSGFVDDPRDCVQKADALVSDVVEQLTTGFSEARSRLEAQWARGEEASTEDLRLALKRYREFFERLLAV
ncbi:hypothetical protein [Mycobacterium sp.]|uniref:hypothetical protein n=1 Tax=Mycobacterium sp. TaxID=1785 RepID=UPI002C9895FC|nr:hypothetical protein [Mycobacterium sp.]HME47100.1 hypothetical protein [Mycobacterium sp.]